MVKHTCVSQNLHGHVSVSPQCHTVMDLAIVVEAHDPEQTSDRRGAVSSLVMSAIRPLPLGPEDVRVAVVNFGLYAKVQRYLSQAPVRSDILRSLQNGHESTAAIGVNTADAFHILTNDVFTGDGQERPEVPNVVLVVLEEMPGLGLGDDTVAAARRAKDGDTIVLVVGIGDTVDSSFLKLLAYNDSFAWHAGLESGDMESLGSEISRQLEGLATRNCFSPRGNAGTCNMLACSNLKVGVVLFGVIRTLIAPDTL